MGEILYGGAIHIREQAKIEAARKTKASGNERRGAESELQRFSASLGNQRILDAAGANITNLTENIARNLDAATFGTMMGRVAAAEELGAAAAMAAAAGVGGSSVETYNATLRLNASMQEEQNTRAVGSDLIAASRQRGNVMIDAVSSLDNNVYAADMDYNEYVDHKKMSLLTKVMTLGTAAAATYFGGPQAGMAVVGLAEAKQKARNGDFGAASQSIIGAMSNGIAAYRDMRKISAPGTESAPAGGQWASTQKTLNSVKLK